MVRNKINSEKAGSTHSPATPVESYLLKHYICYITSEKVEIIISMHSVVRDKY